jgi:N-acetyl-gamma-glutamyl-phosphate reductase
VVFLALPHGESAALALGLAGVPLIVDLGADFRLADADAWSHYYGGAHAGTWVYGLPELPGTRERIAGSTRIANPGCYATAITLSLAPLLAEGLVEPDDLVVVAASGTSGAGRKAAEALLATEIAGSMKAYKVGGVHQHTPEIEQALAAEAGRPVSLLFTPLLAPMSRGIVATSTARLAPSADPAALAAALRAAYADAPFVHVLPPEQWPATASTYGSNSIHLQVAADPRTGRATVVAALDNLVKGAAGQAIQNANLALGMPETTGLPLLGVAP